MFATLVGVAEGIHREWLSGTEEKPQGVDPLFNIPPEMRETPHWLGWKFIPNRDGPKPLKYPKDPKTGDSASSTDPTTWSSFSDAREYARSHDADGVAFAPHHLFTCVDLDECVDDGTINDGASEIIRNLGSYCELSPSETGVHIWLKGPKPGGYRCRAAGIEVYDARQYICSTGLMIEGFEELRSDPEKLAALMDRYGLNQPQVDVKPRDPTPISMSDHELLDVAFRSKNGMAFQALYRSPPTDFEDKSQADFQLFCHLGFWCGRDEERMVNLAMGSARVREKWNSPRDGTTWLRYSIRNALRYVDDVYDPERKRIEVAGENGKENHAKGKGVPKPLDFNDCYDENRVPHCSDIIEGWIGEGEVGSLFGHYGTAKTILCLDQATTLASSEREWFGRVVKERCRVAYLNTESKKRFRYRLNAIHQGRRETGRPLPERGMLEIYHEVPQVFSAGGLGWFKDLLKQAQDEGNPIGMIFIDTLTAAQRGQVSGNDNSLQSELVHAFREAIDPYDAGLLLLGHTGHGGEHLRGASSLGQGFDVMFPVVRHVGGIIVVGGDDDPNAKQRDRAASQRFAFSLKEQLLEDLDGRVMMDETTGGERRSCVVVRADLPDDAANPEERKRWISMTERVAIAARVAAGSRRPLSVEEFQYEMDCGERTARNVLNVAVEKGYLKRLTDEDSARAGRKRSVYMLIKLPDED